jgi:hypothetical protein
MCRRTARAQDGVCRWQDASVEHVPQHVPIDICSSTSALQHLLASHFEDRLTALPSSWFLKRPISGTRSLLGRWTSTPSEFSPRAHCWRPASPPVVPAMLAHQSATATHPRQEESARAWSSRVSFAPLPDCPSLRRLPGSRPRRLTWNGIGCATHDHAFRERQPWPTLVGRTLQRPSACRRQRNTATLRSFLAGGNQFERRIRRIPAKPLPALRDKQTKAPRK